MTNVFHPSRYLAVLAMALLTLASGCAWLPSTAPSPRLDSLPLTDTLERRLTFVPDDAPQRTRKLIALIRLDDEQLRAVFLTPYGQRLATLVHDAEGSRFEEGDLPRQALEEALPVSPEWLASRLEWSLWPPVALEEAFTGTPWSVDIVEDVRVIRFHGRVMARVTPPATDATRDEAVLLDDRQGKYRLRIAPLEAPRREPPE
ncbi:Protein of unknown function [Modicisalibacter ilicicola DSM 19980]|uniref:DUF3261 domain-containing protein n=1 Tax=Modicisalibacter ilicicola DSM 19980 TaxID=1121942 RepID=A0A1M4ZU33_9GAMM|nr:DUF3261 domain-containing protein [Halomonas ilicicola]SHF21539.1 Protein of unknown function [Halomonas ilicicola DSM 19980]